MGIMITDDRMTSDVTDVVAARVEPGRWTLSDRHGLFTREQAITGMTIAEVHAGPPVQPREAALLAEWEQELLIPPMPRDPWPLLQTLKAAACAVRDLPGTQTQFDLAAFLMHLGEAVTDLSVAVGEAAGEAAERDDNAEGAEWRHAAQRASSAVTRLRHAGGELHAGGLAAQRAQNRKVTR